MGNNNIQLEIDFICSECAQGMYEECPVYAFVPIGVLISESIGALTLRFSLFTTDFDGGRSKTNSCCFIMKINAHNF